jgi:ribosomal-protein-alanine N-acetyltransferase
VAIWAAGTRGSLTTAPERTHRRLTALSSPGSDSGQVPRGVSGVEMRHIGAAPRRSPGAEVARLRCGQKPLWITFVDDVISTPRLKLVSLTPSLLRAVAGGDLAEVEREFDASVGAGWEEGVPAERRLAQLAADPSEQPWLVRAVLAMTPRRVVGSIGFHASPDDDGRVEIGYDIVVGERRKGYAREAIHALLDCAWATGHARTCVASVSPGNTPSLALIRAFGFRRVGEHIDEIDGLEWVFERPLPARIVSSETRSPRSSG